MTTQICVEEYLDELCRNVRYQIQKRDFHEAWHDITKAMETYPHEAIPHNLMGILMEREHEHVLAMKHFRIAWVLDPSYAPANFNLEKYSSFYPQEGCGDAYENTDCKTIEKELYKVQYDEHGIGHVVRR